MAGLLKIATKAAGSSKGSSGLARATTHSGRASSSALKSSSAARPSSSSHHSSSHHSSSTTKPSSSSHHRDSGQHDSRSSDPSRSSRQSEPSRSSRHHDSSRPEPRSSNGSRSDSSRYDDGPSRQRPAGRQATSSSDPYGHQMGGSGAGRPPGPPMSPPYDSPPRKPGLKLKMPNNYQIQEGLQTVETLSYTVPRLVGTAQDLKGMMGNKNAGGGGGRPGAYDDQGDFTPSPGGDGPVGRRPGTGQGGMDYRDDDYTPSPGSGDYTPSDDDYTPSPGGKGSKNFDQWPKNSNSRSAKPRAGRGVGGGRYDDYSPSPGGYSDNSDYSPSEDDFTPSPVSSGPKRFDQWPTAKQPSSSGPEGGRGPPPGMTGSRNGPSPLGPGASTQPQGRPQAIPPAYEFPFEKCPHRMKHANGPSNAGPYNYTGNPAPWLRPSPVAFEGYCLGCDTASRRQREQEQLDMYPNSLQADLKKWKQQNFCDPTADEQRGIRSRAQKLRDSKIKEIWGNWNQRWKSPLVTGFGGDGRAVM